MDQLAQMTKMTNTEHDSMFALVKPVDEEAKDGAGTAIVTVLGDRVVPFL